MSELLGLKGVWQVLLAATTSLTLAYMVRLARAPRLIMRLTTHATDAAGKQFCVRLLVHNAETALRIQGFDVRFQAADDAAGLAEVEKLVVNAVPGLRASAEIHRSDRETDELRLTIPHSLQAGRSWLFEFVLPVHIVNGIRCVVTPRLDSWKHSRTLSVGMNANGEMAVTYVDTLAPIVSVIMMTMTAYVTAAALMLLMLEQRTAEAIWWALGLLAMATPLMAGVLHRLLRPNHPYVALGYQESQTLAVMPASRDVPANPTRLPNEKHALPGALGGGEREPATLR